MNDDRHVEQIFNAIGQLSEAAHDGPRARKLLDSLFRSVHNLKAKASANGLDSLANAAHEFENVLHALRTGQTADALLSNALPAEVWNSLKQEQKQAVQQSLAEGARLFLVQTDLDVSDFDRQFQSLKETLNQNGEVISTVPSANKEQPGKVKFRILYATSQTPPDVSDPISVTFAEIPVVTATATGSIERQMSTLESAFQKFAAEVFNSKSMVASDVLTEALRAGELAAQATGKDVVFEVKGDATLLNQLPAERIGYPLLHLIRNAVDHGIETRGKVTISIAQRDDQLSITVSDDGRGIDPALLEQIFQPGFSTATEVSQFSGRGVGLDIVKTCIEELGGSVSVRSTPGQGASFELTLSTIGSA